jgi:peptidyl-prolyl cis-trans isomerase-like 4
MPPDVCLYRLCEIKYYNNCIFHYVQRDFLVQTGDPTKTGRGGESIHGLLFGPQARFFCDEIVHGLKHKEKGMVGMASTSSINDGNQMYA